MGFFLEKRNYNGRKRERRKMIKITYFAHGTTPDNEKKLFSGQNSVGLSKLGVEQMIALPKLISQKNFDLILTSDLERGIESAKLAWPNKKIIKNKLLRECDVGNLTSKEEKLTEKFIEKNGIDKKFPNGESLKDVENRIKNLLAELKEEYPNKEIAIVAHKYTQLALDVLLKNKTWKQAFEEDWRKTHSWKPGWEYILN
jgi:broad specificity phosphatase PhoE